MGIRGGGKGEGGAHWELGGGVISWAPMLLLFKAAVPFVHDVSGVEWGLREGQELGLLSLHNPFETPVRQSYTPSLSLDFIAAPLRSLFRAFS